MSAIFFAALLYLPQFMSKQLGYSAVGSGAGLLPMMGVFAVTSFIAGPLYERLGPKVIVSAGAACLAARDLPRCRASTTETAYRDLVAGHGRARHRRRAVLLVGHDGGGDGARGQSRRALPAAIIYMFQIAGGSIGLGLNTAIVVTAASLSDGIRAAFVVDAILGGDRPSRLTCFCRRHG